MTEQQRKVKALLMKVELLFDESIQRNVSFDEANEYGVLHEIIEVIRENNEITQASNKPSLRVIKYKEE
jgi:hypothetical protein